MQTYLLRRILMVFIIVLSHASIASGKQYKIATVAWIGWSPLHVAKAKGFWKELDLDVDVITYDDPIVILEAMKAKRIDFAMDMAGSLVGVYMEGEPIVAIAETNWSHGGDKIIVRKGDRLVDNLGGVIGVFLRQPSCLFFLGRYLEDIDLKLSDFRIVEINSRDLSAQFIARRLPAIVNYEPWANEAVMNGNGVVLATSADYQGSIPECLWGYQDTIYSISDDVIHSILRGWIKAVQWLKQPVNREEYFDILRKHTFKDETELTDEDFSKMLNAVLIHDSYQMKSRNKDEGGMIQYLSNLRRFLKRNGILKKDYAPSSIFNNQYIMHVLESAPN